MIVRSKVRWNEDGEKSSKYFLGLEKRNAVRKTPTSLKHDGMIFTETPVILRKFTDDLTKKYGKVHKIPRAANEFIENNVHDTLDKVERDALEEPLTLEELTEALFKMKKGKSPGSNGFTACFFFRKFWKKLGPFLYRSFMFCAQNEQSLMTHREGIITIIPKAGKPQDNVKGTMPPLTLK